MQVYISHRRVEGEASEFTRLVCERAELAGFKPLVDHESAEKFRPVGEFIDQLKASHSIIFLLQEDYFKSPWCMSELMEFAEHHVFSY